MPQTQSGQGKWWRAIIAGMDEYLNFALELSERAADIARLHFNSEVKATYKSDNSPLTIADTSINAMVIDSVLNTFSGHSVIGEEGSVGDVGAEYKWICDPIDGTIPFSHGYPTFVFSLALVHEGVAQLAIAVDPVLERTFVAVKDKGATMNGKAIQVKANSDFDRSLISIEGFRQHERADRLRAEMTEAGAMWCRIQSCIYAAALVASGQFGGMVYGGTHAWDAVTSSLLAVEAGGVASDLDGKLQSYDHATVNGLVVAASPYIQGRLLEMLEVKVSVVS